MGSYPFRGLLLLAELHGGYLHSLMQLCSTLACRGLLYTCPSAARRTSLKGRYPSACLLGATFGSWACTLMNLTLGSSHALTSKVAPGSAIPATCAPANVRRLIKAEPSLREPLGCSYFLLPVLGQHWDTSDRVRVTLDVSTPHGGQGFKARQGAWGKRVTAIPCMAYNP